MGCVVRGDAYLNLVSNHHFNSVFFHPSGKYTPYGDIVLTLNFHGAATKHPGDNSLHVNQIVSTQDTPFLANLPLKISLFNLWHDVNNTMSIK